MEKKNATASEVSEAEIAVHWQEEGYYHPPVSFIAQANLTDRGRSQALQPGQFSRMLQGIRGSSDWYKYWETTLDTSNAPFWRWFVGGRINVCYNCVDRHLEKHRNKTAIHFVPEPETRADPAHHLPGTLCAGERGCGAAARLLRPEGGRPGDAAHADGGGTADHHAGLRPLGVIHSQVFSGFSGKACADRIVDSGSTVLITMDGYYRSGAMQDQKEKADIACE